jgi:hypothetical protein
MSGVSAGTFEAAFSHGRWSFNKLGCVGGFRADVTIVPSLGFGLFAAVASTCDFYGDGDALGFPVAATLVPPLDGAIGARLAARQAAAAADAAAYAGTYCAQLPGAMRVRAVGAQLVAEHVKGDDYDWTLLRSGEDGDAFRLMMRPLPGSYLGCTDARWPGFDLCATSCFRQMARGDLAVATFERNASGAVVGLSIPSREHLHCQRS